MSNEVLNLFSNQITENGLEELKAKYPADLVVDMSDESEFKNARKVRTERNKLTKAINDRRLDVTKELKAKGDSLIEQVEEIYSVVVEPFEVEDKRRKEEAERQKRELEEKLNAERARIQSIRDFVRLSTGKDSETIAETIESVDSIETEDFHKDVIHEAIQAKRETIQALTQLLSDTKAREAVEQERAKMAVQERINNLQMIPTTMFGKTVAELGAKIISIENYQVTESEFFDRVGEVEQLKQTVLQQLNMMSQQAKQMEEMQAQTQQAPEVTSAIVDDYKPEQLDIEGAKEKTHEPTVHDKLNYLMYGLTKNAARTSFVDFLEDCGLSESDYSEIKHYLNANLGEVKTYL